jgi:hypothetical protein
MTRREKTDRINGERQKKEQRKSSWNTLVIFSQQVYIKFCSQSFIIQPFYSQF